jgi:hypothetical protein
MESWGNTIVAADGGFSFAHVPPGRFILDIVPGRFADSTAPQEFATTKLIVNGDNASGIVITTRPGITASGRVIVPATATGRKLRIGAVPSEAGALGFRGAAGSALVDEKGRFQMQHVTGSVLFRLFDSQPDLVLRSVTLGDVDITDTPYDSTNGDVSDLAITFVEQAQITGTARNSRGEQVKDFRVALFPATANSASLSARFVRTAAPDSNGRFHIGALPPGEYVAVAVEAFDDGEEWDPAFRQTVVGRAKRVAVKDGQTLTIELPYVE